MNIRQQQKQHTRTGILQAALRKSSDEKGLAGLSLREVAKEAGIAPASFYRHFSDMEALGLALVADAGEALRRIIGDIGKARESAADVVETAVDVCLEHFQAHGSLFRLLAREATGSSPLIRRAIHQELTQINHALSVAIEQETRVTGRPITDPLMLAEAVSIITFHMGIASIDLPFAARREVARRLRHHINVILTGSESLARAAHAERQMVFI